MSTTNRDHRAILEDIARRAMLERGLLPDFSADALAELGRMNRLRRGTGVRLATSGSFLWASIDNDDSRDLDQLTVAEALPADKVKVLVAVADVDALVTRGVGHRRARPAQHDLGVHGGRDIPHAPREALHRPDVAESRRGALWPSSWKWWWGRRLRWRSPTCTVRVCATTPSSPTTALPHWLEGEGTVPEAIAAVPGLAENLRLQDEPRSA